jgi:hypothetical protein
MAEAQAVYNRVFGNMTINKRFALIGHRAYDDFKKVLARNNVDVEDLDLVLEIFDLLKASVEQDSEKQGIQIDQSLHLLIILLSVLVQDCCLRFPRFSTRVWASLLC